MIGAAADQGYVSKSAHGRMPRVQIVTAQELLDGRMPMLPPLPIVEDGPTLRRRKTDRDQLELLLPFAGATNLRLPDGSMVDPRYARFA
jgi:site-specific DNA-methyltransferase (adenine-specific)